MKTGFLPGAIVQPVKLNAGIVPERAEIVRYDCEGFYIVKTPRSSALVVHEDDIELAPRTPADIFRAGKKESW